MTMNDEKEVKKSRSVVRRTKKYGRTSNRELRQSVHELSVNFTDLNIENPQSRPANGLKRSKSFYNEEHVPVTAQSSREILKEYVASIQDDSNIDAFSDNDEKADYINENITNDEFPLHKCIDENNIKDLAVLLLKNENIDLEEKNSCGQTPLIYALALGLSDIVKLLVSSGADVTVKDADGISALRYAVEDGDFEIASLLISNGANSESVQNGF